MQNARHTLFYHFLPYQKRNYCHIKVLSKNPAKIFGINNSIEEGNLANLTIIDLKKEGKINAELFKSKAKFSPFDKWEVKGFPIYTVVNGKVYDAMGRNI